MEMESAPPAKPGKSQPEDPARRHAGERPRWLPLLVVTVVVAASIGLYAFVIYPEPVITLSDFSYVTSGCSRLGNSSTENYTYDVTLANSGSADGSVLVWYYMDGNFVVYHTRYSVPHGTSARIFYTEDWPDCNTHTPSVAITDVAKTW